MLTIPTKLGDVDSHGVEAWEELAREVDSKLLHLRTREQPITRRGAGAGARGPTAARKLKFGALHVRGGEEHM